MGNNSFSIDFGKNARGRTALGGAQTFLGHTGSAGLPGLKKKKGKQPGNSVFTPAKGSAESLEADLLYKQVLMAEVNNESAQVGLLAKSGVEQFPKDTRFHKFLASHLVKKGEHVEAIKYLSLALALEPKNVEILVSIGNALENWGKPHDAIGFYQAALGIDPKNLAAISNLIHLSMAESDWSFFPKLPEMLKTLNLGKSFGNPFNLLAVTDDPAMHRVNLAERDRLLKKNVLKNKKFPAKGTAGDKIRIGYFSSDFHSHATMFLLGKFFENHDRDRFEVYLYDLQRPEESAKAREVRDSADHYVPVATLTDKEVAERARADGLDIAVDMKGFTKGSRPVIFGHRAAPIQVSYLGFPGTTGISAMDYFLADNVTVPANKRRFFVEKIMYMPDCYQVNDNTRSHPDAIPTRTELGLPEGKFVFCSLNNSYKVTPVEYDIWMRLLHAVPDSVLWLLAPNDYVQKNLIDEAAARGIGPERLFFAGRVSTTAHLARLTQADLFLDTFNCCAHTTASETLWSGVPLITKPGDQFASRVAASILTAIGCEDLITDSAENYYDLALKLAQDPAALAEIKQRLKDNLWTTPLYDSEAYIRNFENLMEKAVERQRSGKAPGHLSLTPDETFAANRGQST